MKRVKKIGTYFTLETAQRAAEDDLLCDQCGNGECPVRLIVGRVRINRMNARIGITRCESFMPILTFRDGAGMSEEFNTFRLGGAWWKRVGPGDKVALHTNNGVPIGVAEVINTHSGTFDEMDAQFGSNNHLAIDAEINGRDFDLGKVMKECYGGHRFHNDSTISVIELRRIDGISKEGEEGLRGVC